MTFIRPAIIILYGNSETETCYIKFKISNNIKSHYITTGGQNCGGNNAFIVPKDTTVIELINIEEAYYYYL